MTSKRSIESRLDEIDGGHHDQYPKLNLAVMLSALEADEFEDVEGEPLVRCFGDLYHAPPHSKLGGRLN